MVDDVQYVLNKTSQVKNALQLQLKTLLNLTSVIKYSMQ